MLAIFCKWMVHCTIYGINVLWGTAEVTVVSLHRNVRSLLRTDDSLQYSTFWMAAAAAVAC